MSLMDWLAALEVAEGAEVAGVLVAALLGAIGGASAVVKRLGVLVRKVLGPELVKALVADVAKALRPAVERALSSALAAELEKARPGEERDMTAAVRATVAEEFEDLRAALRHDMQECLSALGQRLATAEGKLEVIQGGLTTRKVSNKQ